MSIKTFSELIEIPTFEERFEYLKLGGFVGEETFGFDRYLNQNFYRSYEWRQLRNQIIIRDNGCDLACEDRDIFGRVIIHHMNPITTDDLIHNSYAPMITPPLSAYCSLTNWLPLSVLKAPSFPSPEIRTFSALT